MLLLALLAAAVPCALAVPAIEQMRLGSPSRVVEVRRYNVTSRQQGLDLIKLAKRANADVWSTTASHVDMVLPSSQSLLADHDYAYTSTYHDIPSPEQLASLVTSKSSTWDLQNFANTTFHSEYHRFEDIISFANDLAKTFPRQVELVRLGHSSEERELLGIKIGKGGTSRKLKPRIIIQGAQHARDWIATSSALHFAQSLLVSKNQDFSQSVLLDTFDFTIIPVPNPDGYEFTWTGDRMWYKNRTPVDKSDRCIGIDMNRNWGYQWEDSHDPCHHWYGGSNPFEAPEVHAIASYIERTPNIRAMIDLRSYGQMIMYPFSYSCEAVPADAEDLIEAALGASKANKNVHGISMATGAACELLYDAPGSMMDWAYATAGIKFSYSVSLRDTGTYGFLLPPKWIRPVGEETGVLIEYISRWAK